MAKKVWGSFGTLACFFAGVVFLAAYGSTAAAEPIRVVATTGMVGDMVSRIGGERVRVQTMMGAGVDPHLYKATAADVAAMQRARVIFYSGIHLEGKLAGILEKLNEGNRVAAAVAEKIPDDRLLQPSPGQSVHDPHIWFDVALWAECTSQVAEVLSKVDPDGASTYQANAERLHRELLELDAWVRTKVAELPAEKRILVTSHDAYGYFGRAYGFRVVGLQGISTVTEAGLADVTRLIQFIKESGIRSIFVESSVPHQAIERIAAESGARIGGELFSDAMGRAGDMENGYDKGTYDGMVRHNVNTIVDSLK